MAKKKILLLIPNLDFGGAQKVFYDHALMFSDLFEVIECVFNLDYGHAYPSGNRLISLDVPAGKNIVGKIYRFIERILKFRSVLKTEKPDLVISHLEGADYVNLLARGRSKKIIVVHGSKLHDQNIESWLGRLRKKILIPLVYRKADQIITVSEGIRQELISYFGISSSKVLTVYNFFSLKKLKEEASCSVENIEQLKLRGKVLISSGRLARQKNQVSLLYILNEIKKISKESVSLILLGDGDLLADLQQSCKELSLRYYDHSHETSIHDHYDVFFMGYQSNPLSWYKYADLFVFPSAWEGFPIALGEAMSVGIPVISSNCPTGPIELIEPNWQKVVNDLQYPYYADAGILMPIPDKKQKESINLWAYTIMKVLENKPLHENLSKAACMRMHELDEVKIKREWTKLVMKDYI